MKRKITHSFYTLLLSLQWLNWSTQNSLNTLNSVPFSHLCNEQRIIEWLTDWSTQFRWRWQISLLQGQNGPSNRRCYKSTWRSHDLGWPQQPRQWSHHTHKHGLQDEVSDLGCWVDLYFDNMLSRGNDSIVCSGCVSVGASPKQSWLGCPAAAQYPGGLSSQRCSDH